jgi:hypothetical protein
MVVNEVSDVHSVKRRNMGGLQSLDQWRRSHATAFRLKFTPDKDFRHRRRKRSHRFASLYRFGLTCTTRYCIN